MSWIILQEEILKLLKIPNILVIFRFMAKYLTVYKNALSTFFQYRLNLGLFLISHSISLSGILYLWVAVYADGQTIGNYTLTGIVTYYLVLIILRMTISDAVGMGFEVVEDINNGVITNHLLKPLSYPLERLFKMFGQASINVLFLVPVLALILWFIQDLIALPSPIQLVQFVIASFFGLLFFYLFYFLVALSSFWVTRGGNFVYGGIIVSSFLNGSLLPLDLFPNWYLIINAYLPFQYFIFIPIQTYLGNITDWFQVILNGTLWLFLMSFAVWFVWRRGVKKFEAVGR